MTLRERIMQRVRDESEAAGTYAGIIQVIALGDLEGVLADELPAADAEREGLAAWCDGSDCQNPECKHIYCANFRAIARLLREPAGVNEGDIYGAMEAERSEVVKNKQGGIALKRVVTVEEDAVNVTAVKTVWTEDEANALLSDGWMLLHGGIAHRDAGGFQAKPVYVLGKRGE